MLGLFYDTESSGMPEWHKPSDDPRQPHIVQLAAHLVDLGDRRIVHTIDLTTAPTDWEIDPGAAEVHGITTERARAIGVPEQTVVDLFLFMWERAHLRIAHNEQFDARMLRIAMKRFWPDHKDLHDAWKAGDKYCTARKATMVCNLPPTARMKQAGRNHPKTPTLTEAYRIFFGKDFGGAHQAIADVNACMDVYWAIQDHDRAGAA